MKFSFKKALTLFLCAALVVGLLPALRILSSAASVTPEELEFKDYVAEETVTSFTPENFTVLKGTEDGTGAAINWGEAPTIAVANGNDLTLTNGAHTGFASENDQHRTSYTSAYYLFNVPAGKEITGYSYVLKNKAWTGFACGGQYATNLYLQNAEGTKFVSHNTYTGGQNVRHYWGEFVTLADNKLTTDVRTSGGGGSQELNAIDVTYKTGNYDWLFDISYTCVDSDNGYYAVSLTLTVYPANTKDLTTATPSATFKVVEKENFINCKIPVMGFAAASTAGVTYEDVTLKMGGSADKSQEVATWLNAHPILIDIKNGGASFSPEDYVVEHTSYGFANMQEIITACDAVTNDWPNATAAVKSLVEQNGYYTENTAATLTAIKEATQAYLTQQSAADAYLVANPIVEKVSEVTVDVNNADTVWFAVTKAMADFEALPQATQDVLTVYDAAALNLLKAQAEIYRTGHFTAGDTNVPFTTDFFGVTPFTDVGGTANQGENVTESTVEGVYTYTLTTRSNRGKNTIIIDNNNKTATLYNWGNTQATATHNNNYHNNRTRLYFKGFTAPNVEKGASKAIVQSVTLDFTPYIFSNYQFTSKSVDVINFYLCSKASTKTVSTENTFAFVKINNFAKDADGVVTGDMSIALNNETAYGSSVEDVIFANVTLGKFDADVFTGYPISFTLDFNANGERFAVAGYSISANGTEVISKNGLNYTRSQCHLSALEADDFGIGMYSVNGDATKNVEQQITVNSFSLEYFDEALNDLRPQALGTTMKIAEDMANQDLAFRLGFGTNLTLPEGYKIDTYGAVVMTNASLYKNYLPDGDLITLGYQGIGADGTNPATPLVRMMTVNDTDCSKLPAQYLMKINGTAFANDAEGMANISGTRFATRGFITIINEATGVKYTFYSVNDNANGDIVTVQYGQINRSLMGCAKNILKVYVSKKPEVGSVALCEGMTLAQYVESTTSTTYQQKMDIINYIVTNGTEINNTNNG